MQGYRLTVRKPIKEVQYMHTSPDATLLPSLPVSSAHLTPIHPPLIHDGADISR